MSIIQAASAVLKRSALVLFLFSLCLIAYLPAALADEKEASKEVKAKIVDVGAVWCVPCKKLNPILDKLKTTYGSKVDFEKLDFDKKDGKDFCDKYKLDSVPSIVIFDNHGKVSYKHSGFVEQPELDKQLSKVAH